MVPERDILLLILESLIRRRGKQIQAISTITCLLLITLPDTASAEEQAAPLGQLGYQALSEGDFAKAVEHYESSIRESDDLARQRDTLYNMGHAKNQIARQTYATGDLSALDRLSRRKNTSTPRANLLRGRVLLKKKSRRLAQ